MLRALGYATRSAGGELKAFEFFRKNLGAHEVLVDIKFCGICHSDVHQAKNEWKNTSYPCMPGHEIIGVVEKLGKNVKGVQVGELVGIGCMIDSCQKCESCKEGLEQYCKVGATGTITATFGIRNPKTTPTAGIPIKSSSKRTFF